MTFQIGQGGFGLTREYLVKGFDDATIKAYYKYMVDVAVIFGANRNRAERELKESLGFEIKLANVSSLEFLLMLKFERKNKFQLFLYSKKDFFTK